MTLAVYGDGVIDINNFVSEVLFCAIFGRRNYFLDELFASFPSDAVKHSNLSITHRVVFILELSFSKRVVESTTSYTFLVQTGAWVST